MSVIQLHIVGIPYRKDIAGHVSEFLAEVPGHIMTLRPHLGNDHDELLIERKRNVIWIHFAVRPSGNRRRTNFKR